jgi:hypothetical protein
MSKVSRRLVAVTAGLMIMAVAGGSVFANHAWRKYHWARTANPFDLRIGGNVSSGWSSHLNTAVADWDKSNVMTLRSVAGSAGSACNMVAGTVQVCNGAYGSNGWLGLASINITNRVHITQGSAKMNDTYFNTSTYNNPNEKLHVMCQEIGHTFGLGHTSENGTSQNTCMDYFSNTGANAGSTISTHPNQHDYDMLASIYSHLDSFSTNAGAAAVKMAGKSDVNHDDPNSWGELMSQSANGRSSTYKRQNDDGSETLTHVFWTIEAAADCPSCDHRHDH